ncbi:MAG TPA: histidinol-phosphatase [Firmicutes bacterium]|nr:histidinol-phosphatase [Bacillota bacterium]
MIDYHMHLERGPLTREWLGKFIEAARQKGIAEVGISEHCTRFIEFAPVMDRLGLARSPFPHVRRAFLGEVKSSMNDYVKLIDDAKAEGLPVKLALEVDYVPGAEEETRKILSQFPFDYIIGSVHFLGEWPIDFRPEDWQGQDPEEIYIRYFEILARAAKSHLFDVMAHPDLVKLFGIRPVGDPSNVEKTISLCIQQLAESDVAVEVSSAGLRRPIGEIYPGEKFLRRCAELDIPITLASDAHRPEEVGFRIDEAAQYARECGCSKLAIFRRRQRYFIDLA